MGPGLQDEKVSASMNTASKMKSTVSPGRLLPSWCRSMYTRSCGNGHVYQRKLTNDVGRAQAPFVAYQEWGVGNPKKVLAVHGWLDNSSSFIRTGRKLASEGYHVVAVDNAGHGRSGHLKSVEDYCVNRNVEDIKSITDKLQWDKFHLIGHSMGSAVCIHFASQNPARAGNIVIMEVFGPCATANEIMRNISPDLIKNSIKTSTAKEISGIAEAVRIKQKAAGIYSKNLIISDVVAGEIISRASELVTGSPSGPLKMRHDPRLSIVAYVSNSNNDILPRLLQLQSKILVIDGQDGWQVRDSETAEYIKTIKLEMVARGLWYGDIILPGSHHLHADPESEEAVNSAILTFFNAYTG
jgi:pimeloyl-ACP methyl ester carboxylesterase